MVIVSKRRASVPLNRSVPDERKNGGSGKNTKQILAIENLIFLDESGVNLGMVRRYGRAIGGQRVVDYSPLNRP